MNTRTYTARWLFPVDAPPIERGSITIANGKITAVEPHGSRTADIDLGNVAILPGFVNAHTHLDLSGARGQCPPTPDFTQWLRRVIGYRQSRSPEQLQSDIAAGLAECMRFGTTAIGDIASGGASWHVLSQAKCRAVVFYELLGLSEERSRSNCQLGQTWLDQHPSTELCVAGFSPHAPYSVRSTQYSVLSRQAIPIATHLAETAAEVELLRDRRTGPFVDFLQEMDAWDESGLVHDPLDVVNLLPNGIFIHGNCLDPDTPITPRQSIVICPRTHAAFKHPRHPFPALLQRGVRVALGTDSLASNPDLDILTEARFLRQHYPEVEPAMLLRMLTLSGAEALRVDAHAGSLTVGKSADLVFLPLPNVEPCDPHELIFDSTLPIASVMFQGEC
jgi:cytosine/adenosine deaminase-related metal-dependent hydrolase